MTKLNFLDLIFGILLCSVNYDLIKSYINFVDALHVLGIHLRWALLQAMTKVLSDFYFVLLIPSICLFLELRLQFEVLELLIEVSDCWRYVRY